MLAEHPHQMSALSILERLVERLRDLPLVAGVLAFFASRLGAPELSLDTSIAWEDGEAEPLAEPPRGDMNA